MAGDGQLAHQMIVGDRPPCLQIGEGLGVDDDEKVIVGDVAAGAILDPIAARVGAEQDQLEDAAALAFVGALGFDRSEEHTSELQSLMRISYAVFCLKK